MPNIYKFNIGNDFVVKATAAIEDFVENSNEELVRIALSGGSSPKAIYEKLSESKKIDWSKVELFQVDERHVASNSDESNARMIEESLTSRTPSLKAFHKFDTKKSIEDALEGYEKLIRTLSTPLFDLVLLGLGTDGHTASLFPGGPELNELERMTVHSVSPSGVADRLSLTFPAIMNSQKIIFLIRGEGKKDIVERLLNSEESENEIPAKIALEHDNVDLYYDYS